MSGLYVSFRTIRRIHGGCEDAVSRDTKVVVPNGQTSFLNGPKGLWRKP